MANRFVDGIEVLDEQIVYQNGPFLRIKRWLRGAHPHLGTLVQGYTGWETLVEKDVIRPQHTFFVLDTPLDVSKETICQENFDGVLKLNSPSAELKAVS